MVYAASKWCVFRDIGQPVTREYVLEAVQERCRRLRGRVDLLQFHWHNVCIFTNPNGALSNTNDNEKYEAKEYLDILVHLVAITKSHPELVSSIGLCNFDSKHTIEACEYLLEKTGEVGIVSNQVQVSCKKGHFTEVRDAKWSVFGTRFPSTQTRYQSMRKVQSQITDLWIFCKSCT